MTKIFAHRGFSGKYPENTMLAFEKAIEAGCDGIELDVHLSRDGKLVIIHDEWVDRTTNGKGCVKDMTVEQLKQLDASAGFAGTYGINRIITLEEYFDRIKNENIVTNIELKTGVFTYPGIEEKTLELIDRYDLRSRIIISSFNHYSVLHFKKLASDIPCGFLEESWIIGMAEYAQKYGVEYVHPIYCAVNADFVSETERCHIGINTWTVNDEADMKAMLKFKVHGLITNYPDRCKTLMNIEKHSDEC